MKTVTCKECNQKYEINPSANYIVICPCCLKRIICECEYGFGPITPCQIYIGDENIARINKKQDYYLNSNILDIHTDLLSGYKDLEVYKEAEDILIKKLSNQ